MTDPLTVAQAAAELGLSPSRVRALCADGTIPHTLVNPRLILIDRRDLAAARKRRPRGRPQAGK